MWPYWGFGLAGLVVSLTVAVPVTPLLPVDAEETHRGREAASQLFTAQLRRAEALAAVGALPALHSILNSPGIGWEVAANASGFRDPRGLRAVASLLRMLHAQQQPPRAACRDLRLLVVQFQEGSLEGAGSILKIVMAGLAEAAYSNRTLVWGADLTPTMELSRRAWQPAAAAAATPGGVGGDAHPVVHGIPLDCRAWGGGGAFGCFLEPLSSCSLADATWEELRGLGTHGHDRAARIKVMEGRRNSPAAYHLPPITGYGSDNALSDTPPPRHLWAAALAAYAFRPQPRLAAAFERTRANLDWEPDTGCMHVRHGDVHALQEAYTNRVAFPFTAYFDALRAMSDGGGGSGGGGGVSATAASASTAAMKVRAADAGLELVETPVPPRPLPPPAAVFIASDSTRVQDELAAERARGKRWGPHTQPLPATAGAPRLFAVNQSRRFLTPHGSHSVASGGACTNRGTCALPWEVIVEYKREAAAAPEPPPPVHARLMSVFYESFEDLYLLAHCTRLAAVACSHFSTLAALLAWAGTGGRAAGRATAFLDSERVGSGELASMFLHGMFNSTHRASPGRLRWLSLTTRFPGGVWPEDAVVAPLRDAALTPPEALLHQDPVTSLPAMPPEVFWPEVQAWAGGGRGAASAFPSACPAPRLPHESDQVWVAGLVNLGAQHSSQHHYDQAFACWRAAEEALLLQQRLHGAASPREKQGALPRGTGSGGGGGSPPLADDGSLTPAVTAEYLDVAVGNQRAVQHQEWRPYSLPPAALAHALAAAAIVDAGGSGRGGWGDEGEDEEPLLRLPPDLVGVTAGRAAPGGALTESAALY